MLRRLSLRARVVAAFVVLGAVLGPLMALTLFFFAYEMEERMIRANVKTQLQEVVANPERFDLDQEPTLRELRVLSRTGLTNLPVEMFALADGVHEYEVEQGSWMIGIATVSDGRRYAVVEDITLLEKREFLGLVVAGVGTLLSIYVALWLGYYLSRRLLASLTSLAERVAADNEQHPPQPFAQDYAADEVGVLASAIDRYRQRMSEALRREREFSANASHELRNPLAIIQNAAEIIEDDLESSVRSRRAAHRINAAAQRMNETVSTLLLMVRETASSTAYEPIAVAGSVEEVLLQQESAVNDAGVKLVWHCHARPRIAAPSAAVESVVSNLIRNALLHSNASTITVELHPDYLAVSDDGVGIQHEEMDKLTERGWRGTSAANDGYGIGLSLVQRLCERFGWRLSLSSEPNLGTRAEWHFTPYTEKHIS